MQFNTWTDRKTETLRKDKAPKGKYSCTRKNITLVKAKRQKNEINKFGGNNLKPLRSRPLLPQSINRRLLIRSWPVINRHTSIHQGVINVSICLSLLSSLLHLFPINFQIGLKGLPRAPRKGLDRLPLLSLSLGKFCPPSPHYPPFLRSLFFSQFAQANNGVAKPSILLTSNSSQRAGYANRSRLIKGNIECDCPAMTGQDKAT